MMPVAFNPNASATPNLTKTASADDAPGSVSPNNSFAQLLSTASGAQPTTVAALSPDHPDVNAGTDDEDRATDVAASAAVPLPWLPMGMTLSLATDVAVETGVAPEALRREGALRANVLTTVPAEAAGSALLPGIVAPSTPTPAIGIAAMAASIPGVASGNDATTAAAPAARTRTVRPAVEGAGENRKADVEALGTASADRLGGNPRVAVDAAPAVVPAVASEPPGAHPFPAGAIGEATALRTGTARPYIDALPPAAVILQLPPEVARETTGATRKAALDTIPGSMLPVTPTGAATPAAVVAIETKVNAPGWTAEVAQKFAQVILFRNETAEIRLNPPQLGPVDVRISFAADQPTLLITAPDPATRGALEQALPHLRDLLAQHGITLGQASVQGDRQSPHAFAQPTRDPTGVAGGTANAPGDDPLRTARPDWLVDLYA